MQWGAPLSLLHWGTYGGPLHWGAGDMREARQRPVMLVGEDRNAACHFLDKLDAGELLTGTPTVVDVDSVLTLSAKAVNAEEITVDDRTCAAGQAVQWHVDGGAANTLYTIRVTVETDAGQTLVCDCPLLLL